MIIGEFSGRRYRGKRRNYCYNVAKILAKRGSLTFSEILFELSLEKSKNSQENIANIQKSLKSSVQRALNNLHKYEHIYGRNLIDKYQRNKYALTIKGISALIIYDNNNKILDKYKIKYDYNYDQIKVIPFKTFLVEDHDSFQYQIDYIKNIIPLNFIFILFINRLLNEFRDSNSKNLPLSLFQNQCDRAATYAHFVIKLILNMYGITHINGFSYKVDIDAFKDEAKSWLNDHKIKDKSEINKKKVVIDSGRILLSEYEDYLVSYSNFIQRLLEEERNSDEKINQDLLHFYIKETEQNLG